MIQTNTFFNRSKRLRIKEAEILPSFITAKLPQQNFSVTIPDMYEPYLESSQFIVPYTGNW